MVPLSSMLFMVVSLLLSVATPIVVAVILKKKGFGTWAAFFAGMLGFVVLQLIIRIPILQLLGTTDWFIAFSKNLVWYALALAFTAGLFETVGRYLVFKLILRKKRSYGDGLMAGLGHGGIEAIVIGGGGMLNNLIYSAMINSGTSDQLLAQLAVMPKQQQVLTNVFEVLKTSASPVFLAGGIERIFAMILHIGLSLLVLEGIKRKKAFLYCLFALLYHTLLDFTAVMMNFSGINLWIIELVVLGFVILPFIYLFVAKKRFAQLDALAKPLE